MKQHHSMPDNATLDLILRDKMEEILELIEAIATDQPDCDLKLAELLEGEPDARRQAIVQKIRDILRLRADEKEQQLDQYLEVQKRVEVVRQRNIFMQWLAWFMSEETLRKIELAFSMRPTLEGQVRNLGKELAEKGVLGSPLQQHGQRRELGELSANVAQIQGQGKEKDTGKGRV